MSSTIEEGSNIMDSKWFTLLAVAMSVCGAGASVVMVAVGCAYAQDSNLFSLGLIGLVFSASCLVLCHTMWRDRVEFERIDAAFKSRRPQSDAPASERPDGEADDAGESVERPRKDASALDLFDFIARSAAKETHPDDRLFEVEFYSVEERVPFRTTQYGHSAKDIVHFWNSYVETFPDFRYRVISATPTKKDPTEDAR